MIQASRFQRPLFLIILVAIWVTIIASASRRAEISVLRHSFEPDYAVGAVPAAAIAARQLARTHAVDRLSLSPQIAAEHTLNQRMNEFLYPIRIETGDTTHRLRLGEETELPPCKLIGFKYFGTDIIRGVTSIVLERCAP